MHNFQHNHHLSVFKVAKSLVYIHTSSVETKEFRKHLRKEKGVVCTV